MPNRIAFVLGASMAKQGKPTNPEEMSKRLDKQTTQLKRIRMSEHKKSRELRRLRTSPTFKLSILFIRAFERPYRFLWLPISMVLLVLNTIRERLGTRSIEPEVEPVMETLAEFSINSQGKTIVFFPTNGVGFGHFTRLFAVARRLKEIEPDADIIFFTTMPTLHLLKYEGIPSYHIPGRNMLGDVTASEWNMLCEENLSNLFSIHNPAVFVFDGTFPYRGMLNAIRGQEEIDKVWVRRGTFKKGATRIPVDSIDHFDVIIRPSDSVEAAKDDHSEIDAEIFDCEPIIFASKDELKPREYLRNRLGIPSDAIVAYVQLGAGQINDIESDIAITLSELAKHENVYTVVGESMLGSPITYEGPRLRFLRDYPNSINFKAFDFAVTACGYNSYHEMIHFGLPSICYPNLNTGMDDQLARARVAEKSGAMIVLTDINRQSVSSAVEKILDTSTRQRMQIAAVNLIRDNGADQVAEYLAKVLKSSNQ